MWSTQRRSTSAPARSIGRVMFSAAVRVGTRLNDWKTKPSRSRRSRVSWRSFSEETSTPATRTEPDVNRSSPAMQCISVDLPDPEGPMMAVNRPVGEVDVDVVEGDDPGLAGAVHLGGVADGGGRRRACRARRGGGGAVEGERHGMPAFVRGRVVVRPYGRPPPGSSGGVVIPPPAMGGSWSTLPPSKGAVGRRRPATATAGRRTAGPARSSLRRSADRSGGG